MSVVIETGVTQTNLPRIGWRVQAGDVSASTEAEGYEAERAVSQQTFDGWQPTAMPATWALDAGDDVDVDYCAIAAHDLGTVGATVFVEHWDGAAWAEVASAAPDDDSAILFLFPSIEAQEWRIRVTGSDEPTIGHIRFGQVLTVPRLATYTGDPLDETERVTLRHNLSETGEYLGAIVEGNGLQFSVEIDHLPEAFRQGEWRAFKRWAEAGNTFFIAPKPGPYPAEVAYAWTRRAAVTRQIPNASVSGSVTLDCTGYAKP